MDTRIIGVIFILGTSFFVFSLNRQTIRKTIAEYAVTSKRVLLKSNTSPKKTILQISFLEINDCIVIGNENNRGTIFFNVKNPESIPFDTYAPKDDGVVERRHQPTLENIENPHVVAELIRQGVKNANTLL